MFFILGLLSLLPVRFTFAQDTVMIGLDVSLTGSYADRGADELKAYKLAIEENNSQGGIW